VGRIVKSRIHSSKFKSRSLYLSFVAAVSGCTGSIAFAQSVALPELVVSASETPLQRERVGASVTVITAQEISEKNLQTVADTLKSVPGVEVDSQGGRGSLTSVRIRGGESRHVKVIIDGIEVNQLGFPGFDFADLTTDDIERIEVLRGPQSGIYGASAQDGVITIITKSGRGMAKPSVNGRYEYGSFKTSTGSMSARGSSGPVYGAFSITDYTSRGYNISRTGNENDGSHALVASSKVGVDVTPDLNIEGVARHTARATEFDSPSTANGLLTDADNFGKYQSQAGRINATFSALNGHWVQQAGAGILSEQTRSYTNGAVSFGANGTRKMLDYKSTFFGDTKIFGGEKHTLTLFTDHKTEGYARALIVDPFSKKSRTGLGTEYILDLPTHTTFSGALRRDWNSAFDDVTTWRAALSQRLPATGTRVHTSIGKGVTDPDVFALFGSTFNNPNPNLRPEQSVGWDVGVEQKLLNEKALVDVTYFNTTFKDKIEGVASPNPPFFFMYTNGIGAATRRGVEISNTIQWLDWLSTRVVYTYTHAVNSLGQQEIRRPPNSGSFEITTAFLENRLKANLRVSYNGVREDAYFNGASTVRVDLPATTVVRGSISYDATQWATVYVRAENIFNASYEDTFSYRASGFAAFAGLKLKYE
jgi:vitamin B12 transporter